MAVVDLADLASDQLNAIEKAKAWYRSSSKEPFFLRGAAGTGKGHPLDTEVPTPDGLRLWGSLEVGDLIYGANGQPTPVTAIHDRGVLPVYRMTMKHGESVLVDGDHLWATYKSKNRSKIRVVDTEWLSHQPLKGTHKTGYLFKIPVAGAVQRPDADLPVHPYVIGSLVSNGGLTSNGTMLITPDDGVVAKIRLHTEARFCPGHACPTYNLVGLAVVTRALGMRVHSRDKRIPRVYINGSVGQRLDLLNGLFDGDGSTRDKSRSSVLYHTTSSGLAEDVTELVTSLGGTCSVAKSDRSHHGKPLEYTCTVMLPDGISAFSTERKVQGSSGRRPTSAIVSIEPAGVAPVRCIEVAAEDSLYLITRNHIVTHNTTVARFIVQALGTTTQALAPTNRAAKILRWRGIDDAKTIHSVLFMPTPWCVTENHEVNSRCVQEEAKHKHGVRFFKRHDPPEGVMCFTIDEASMVGERIGNDIAMFGIKTLVIGDPFQLQPVGDKPAYTMDLPGATLDASHRFHSMSDVGKLANRIRTSSSVKEWKGILPYVGFADVDNYDLLLAWRNETRWQIITTLRSIRGRSLDMPQIGDRLISVANTYEAGVLNADELTVVGEITPATHMGAVNIPTAEAGVVTAWRAGFKDFDGEKWAAELARKKGADICALTFSECMTVHKAQGGEWSNVLVVDDLDKMKWAYRDEPGGLNTWAYTAVTRASQRVDFIKISDFPTGMALRKMISAGATS